MFSNHPQRPICWETANGGGGGNVSCDFGGGKRTIECALQLRKWDLSGLCPFPLRKMTLREQRGGGENVSQVAGSKTVLGEGFYGFPLPLGRAKGGAKRTEKQSLARMAPRKPFFEALRKRFLRRSPEGNSGDF